MQVTKNTVRALCIAYPVYERATLTVGEQSTVAEGTLLGRVSASGELTPYAADATDGSQTPVAVMPYDITLTDSARIDALVSGRVRRVMLSAAGAPISNAEADALRSMTIIAIDTVENTVFDNE